MIVVKLHAINHTCNPFSVYGRSYNGQHDECNISNTIYKKNGLRPSLSSEQYRYTDI